VLAGAEPPALRRALEKLSARPAEKARAISLAEDILRKRLNASLGKKPVRESLEAEQRFDLYDDVLRLLALRGIFDGDILYPLVGPDFLPARWAKVSGINWSDYRRLFNSMVRLVGRARYAITPSDKGPAKVLKPGSIFNLESLKNVLTRFPRRGPRTLLIKHVAGYNQDWIIDAAKSGSREYGDAKGLLPYARWLRRICAETILAGDFVVLLSKDPAARAHLDASGDFELLPIKLPVLSRVEPGMDVIYSEMQALLFPDDLRVYRKVR
jgi:hypothetical protein